MSNISPKSPNTEITRRGFLASSASAAAGTLLASRTGLLAAESQTSGPVVIGSRRELFIDGSLIDSTHGGLTRRLHHPVPQEIVLVHDAPWEGSGSGYHSIFHDGEKYRMYYKAWHLAVSPGKVDTSQHPLFCCYAESDDGITWRKPNLGLHEFNGSKENNIAIASGKIGSLKIDAGHPAIFQDANPDAASDAQYKAIVRSSGKNGLIPLKSADGLRWVPMTDAPILSGQGAFDSQNLAFWDPNIGKYRAYWRYFIDGRRAIRTATSDDLVNWSPCVDLTYRDSPPEQLYTNQIKPYYRAPHLLIGFPTRYVERGGQDSLSQLPEPEHRAMRSSASGRYGYAITEALVMASRDGEQFERWNEAFLRPGPQRSGTWNYGHQYIGWHVVETASALPGAAPELSLYATESYWTGKSSELRRYTLRLDGFVSLNAPLSGGELITKPITFTGKKLRINFASSAAGGVRVEIQTPDGTPVPGYELTSCHEAFGDETDRVIHWKNGADVSNLAEKPIRLRFVVRDADVFAYRFVG